MSKPWISTIVVVHFARRSSTYPTMSNLHRLWLERSVATSSGENVSWSGLILCDIGLYQELIKKVCVNCSMIRVYMGTQAARPVVVSFFPGYLWNRWNYSLRIPGYWIVPMAMLESHGPQKMNIPANISGNT